MFCRTSSLLHSHSGVRLETPLLVPSFSSKGFPRYGGSGRSEIRSHFLEANSYLTDVFLISAYDLYYGDIPYPDKMPGTPDLIFLDSGGYELAPISDTSYLSESNIQPRPWRIDQLRDIHSNWPDHVPAVFVSFDDPRTRRPLAQQVSDAHALLSATTTHLKLLLLKPETRRQMTLNATIQAALSNVQLLSTFDIIGVTEKELGSTPLDRMTQIARLRVAMDDGGIEAPLHIFGALDPLSVCLYFLSGAEIFDGLTWLRFRYHDGLCVYIPSMGAKTYGVRSQDSLVRQFMRRRNYESLFTLRRKLMNITSTGSLASMGSDSEFLGGAVAALRQRLKRRR